MGMLWHSWGYTVHYALSWLFAAAIFLKKRFIFFWIVDTLFLISWRLLSEICSKPRPQSFNKKWISYLSELVSVPYPNQTMKIDFSITTRQKLEVKSYSARARLTLYKYIYVLSKLEIGLIYKSEHEI